MTAPTMESCKMFCVRARTGSEICVGFSYNFKDMQCYLKTDADARKLEDDKTFLSARVPIGKFELFYNFCWSKFLYLVTSIEFLSLGDTQQFRMAK